MNRPTSHPQNSVERSLYHELRPILNELTSPYPQTIRLQEKTILAIVWNIILTGGYDRAEFWRRPDTCAESTYKKWRKDDPSFVPVLERAIDAGWKWSTKETATAVQDAMAIIQLAAPEAAQTIVNIMLSGEHEGQRRLAADSILNRVEETAEKGQANVSLSLDEVQRLRQQAEAELGEWLREQEQEHLHT
ncbi:MAG: hypothetical protein KF770_22895 [Anaerolineae bacterium]|nr:hypothetical protein [Anaerolineae bacterium]